ncbi:ammonium transporter [Luteococcus japonicus]|uniref:Ammonium transporter n=1 Tax=Luteococcus japonicus LSP_Lj1 TaxID=1255658 RepID=A0A1R4ICD0_9ACTN|nr:ammonium transporter [Luteococcus japonicus]SJN17497.1 Ammonium transporter [Luteococcus japonicus LSP_Lj1]
MNLIQINAGDTAWVMVSAALVLLMTPALALFYAGMVRSKGVLNMMMMSVLSMGIIAVLWVLYGYSMTFGDSWHGLLGNPFQFAGMRGMAEATVGPEGHQIPAFAFAGFQAAFAIIAVALISGAVADRMKFSAWVAFSVLWATLCYFPAAHWVFAFDGFAAEHGGWIANDVKAFDFAGGTAIHINAGAAALVLAVALGPRIGFRTTPMRPHNLTLVMLGAGLLWFGWFGFNGGSALAANGLAAMVWVNTLVAAGAAMLGWLATERLRDGHATSLGAASGIVAGLVGITPGCSVVTPLGALAIGAITGVCCAWAIGLKYRFGIDDSLDVVGVHLVGGLVGTLAAGLFAKGSLAGGAAGLFYGGGLEQLGRQAVGAVAVLLYSLVVSYLLARLVDATVGLRIDRRAEAAGIDLAEHAESGYDLSRVQYSSYSKSLVVPRPEKSPKEEVEA